MEMSEKHKIRVQAEYEAMQVGVPSWKAVAEWSGGEIIKGFRNRIIYLSFPKQGGGRVSAAEGSWITKGSDGSLDFHTDAEFKARFTPC